MHIFQSTHHGGSAVARTDFLASRFAAPHNLLLTPAGMRFLGDGLAEHGTTSSVANHRPETSAKISTDIGQALANFSRLPNLVAGGRGIRIVVSDLWVRYSLVEVNAAASLDESELLALARGQLSRDHPDTIAWPFRCALHGETLQAAACPPALIDGLQMQSDKYGVRLESIVPLFAYLWDQTQRGRRNPDGWLLLEEPGLVMVAFVRAGCISAQHAARQNDPVAATAMRLLERQSALLGIAPGEVRLFSAADRPIVLSPPWRVVNTIRF